jgi:hypothetical protein
MTREDDREYWRREDERRDRDREYWRDQDLRDEDRRLDRAREELERSEQAQEARRDLRKGHTAWALRNLLGPEAAIEYLRWTEGSGTTEELVTPPSEEAGDWPKHGFVRTLAELVENVVTAPQVEFEVNEPDKDGDVLVRALVADPFLKTSVGSLWTSLRGGVPYRREHGKFWVKGQLLATLPAALTSLERTSALIQELSRYSSD